MRGILVLAMFTATLAHSAWSDYVEVRNLRLDADGVSKLSIDAGAGSLGVTGDAAAVDIVVEATITVPGKNEDDARRIIESDMVLVLDRDGDRAILSGYFDGDTWEWDEQPHIALQVRVPERIGLTVDDGSGSVEIRDVRGDITLDDGSGSVSMIRVGGRIEIDDGSGSIVVEDVGSDIRIVDGSGSITVRQVAGSVYLDDGSGGIDVSDVGRDLIIEDDGSGSVNFQRVKGRVEQDN